jgi:hypothetical protein
LSTLRLDAKRKSFTRTTVTYVAIALFCGLFSAVYLHFSYGQSSPFLVWLFVPPLFLGALPAFLAGKYAKKLPLMAARRIWNSAVATLTTGFLVRAVINISGRYTDYDGLYWVLAGALFFAAVLWQIAKTAQRKARSAISV